MSKDIIWLADGLKKHQDSEYNIANDIITKFYSLYTSDNRSLRITFADKKSRYYTDILRDYGYTVGVDARSDGDMDIANSDFGKDIIVTSRFGSNEYEESFNDLTDNCKRDFLLNDELAGHIVIDIAAKLYRTELSINMAMALSILLTYQYFDNFGYNDLISSNNINAEDVNKLTALSLSIKRILFQILSQYFMRISIDSCNISSCGRLTNAANDCVRKYLTYDNFYTSRDKAITWVTEYCAYSALFIGHERPINVFENFQPEVVNRLKHLDKTVQRFCEDSISLGKADPKAGFELAVELASIVVYETSNKPAFLNERKLAVEAQIPSVINYNK